ncbi:MAG: hypothetical protein NTW19_17710 [Planctomycetota bacterium]|nr:hypothetical protein [Planctomycetota bacterium]
MVDVELRRKLAYDLRQLALGRMRESVFGRAWGTVFQNTHDPGIRAILDCPWLDSELTAGMLTANRRRRQRVQPSRGLIERRRRLARVLVFLYSDRPYEWDSVYPPFESGLKPSSLALMLLGVVGCATGSGVWFLMGLGKIIAGFAAWVRRVRRYYARPEVQALRQAQSEFWPFRRESDLVEALSRPVLLAGR